jgi:hypothetical protein
MHVAIVVGSPAPYLGKWHRYGDCYRTNARPIAR